MELSEQMTLGRLCGKMMMMMVMLVVVTVTIIVLLIENMCHEGED